MIIYESILISVLLITSTEAGRCQDCQNAGTVDSYCCQFFMCCTDTRSTTTKPTTTTTTAPTTTQVDTTEGAVTTEDFETSASTSATTSPPCSMEVRRPASPFCKALCGFD